MRLTSSWDETDTKTEVSKLSDGKRHTEASWLATGGCMANEGLSKRKRRQLFQGRECAAEERAGARALGWNELGGASRMDSVAKPSSLRESPRGEQGPDYSGTMFFYFILLLR